jgi:hypothetical protein
MQCRCARSPSLQESCRARLALMQFCKAVSAFGKSARVLLSEVVQASKLDHQCVPVRGHIRLMVTEFRSLEAVLQQRWQDCQSDWGE